MGNRRELQLMQTDPEILTERIQHTIGEIKKPDGTFYSG